MGLYFGGVYVGEMTPFAEFAPTPAPEVGECDCRPTAREDGWDGVGVGNGQPGG